MYERFYGFRERPFSLLPDPDFLYLGEKHRTALDLLELALVNQSGFCVISGEIGAGKTTLIRELLNRLDEHVRVGLVSNTHRSFGELMQWIMAAYGLPCGTGDRLELHKHFIEFVIRNYAQRQTTLLIIDEAQNLSVSAMEELRMLSNVNSDKDLVLQVILVGQGQLRAKLKQPVLEQFAQRIAIDFHLPGLTEEETGRYIRHRTGHAGAAADLFSDAACRTVYHFSKGIPRLINRICDLSLVYGYAGECPQITAELVQAVVDDQRVGKVLDAARKHPGSAHLPSLKAVVPTGSDDLAPAAVHNEPPRDQAPGSATTMPAPRDEQSDATASQSADRGLPVPPSAAPAADVATEAEGGFAQQSENTAEAAPAAAAGHAASGSDSAVTHGRDKTAQAPVVEPDAAAQPVRTEPVHQDAAQNAPSEDAPAIASQLHTLVVNAEQRKRGSRVVRAGLWLWTACVVVAGAAAGWSTHDTWYPLAADAVTSLAGLRPETKSASTAVRAEPPPQAASQPVAVATPPLPAVEAVPEQAPAPEPAAPVAQQASAPAQTQSAPASTPPQPTPVAAADAPGQNDSEAARAAALAREQQAAAAEQAAQETELRREQQRLARVKEEAERMKRERVAAERKLAEQRKARLALEQQARRDQEKLRKTSQSVGVPPAQATHSQRAVSPPAPGEQVQAVTPPADAEQRVQGVFVRPAQIPRDASVAAGDPKPAAAPPPAAASSVEAPAARAQTQANPKEQPQAASDKFLANPCNGPTARFMSTCF